MGWPCCFWFFFLFQPSAVQTGQISPSPHNWGKVGDTCSRGLLSWLIAVLTRPGIKRQLPAYPCCYGDKGSCGICCSWKMSKSFSQGLRPVGSQWFSDWREGLGIWLRPWAGGVSAVTSTGKSLQVAQQNTGERLNWQQRRERLGEVSTIISGQRQRLV